MPATVIACPHPGCDGVMGIVPGGEVERMFQCEVCGEFVYWVGAVVCMRCCLPTDLATAKALLGEQRLKPEIVAYLAERRRRWGLPEEE